MCLNEITKDEPITKGYKVFCNETEDKVSPIFFGKPIRKGKLVNAKSWLYKKLGCLTDIPYVKDRKPYRILGKEILYNVLSSYEAGFHTFHNREDAEKYVLFINGLKQNDKWYYFWQNIPKSYDNLVIKEVIIKDPICVGYQKIKDFTALITVSRKIYVL